MEISNEKEKLVLKNYETISLMIGYKRIDIEKLGNENVNEEELIEWLSNLIRLNDDHCECFRIFCLNELQNQRNKLNRQISTLKKANLN